MTKLKPIQRRRARLVAPLLLLTLTLAGCGGDGHSQAWTLGQQAGASYVSHAKCVRDANGAVGDGWFPPDQMATTSPDATPRAAAERFAPTFTARDTPELFAGRHQRLRRPAVPRPELACRLPQLRCSVITAGIRLKISKPAGSPMIVRLSA